MSKGLNTLMESPALSSASWKQQNTSDIHSTTSRTSFAMFHRLFLRSLAVAISAIRSTFFSIGPLRQYFCVEPLIVFAGKLSVVLPHKKCLIMVHVHGRTIQVKTEAVK
jgi:hypothetical protein